MIKRDKEGLYFVSGSGIRYDLLEGLTICGDKEYTSDTIFIMLGDTRYFGKVDNGFVNYIMGATFLKEGFEKAIKQDIEQFDKDIAFFVDTYEINYNLKNAEVSAQCL